MTRMVVDAGALFDESADARKCPELAWIAVRLRTVEQIGSDLVQLLLAQAGLGARGEQFQSLRAALSVAFTPLAQRGSANADAPSDLGVGQVSVQQSQCLLAQVLDLFSCVSSRHTSQYVNY